MDEEKKQDFIETLKYRYGKTPKKGVYGNNCQWCENVLLNGENCDCKVEVTRLALLNEILEDVEGLEI